MLEVFFGDDFGWNGQIVELGRFQTERVFHPFLELLQRVFFVCAFFVTDGQDAVAAVVEFQHEAVGQRAPVDVLRLFPVSVKFVEVVL